jgi:hypothetical protein
VGRQRHDPCTGICQTKSDLFGSSGHVRLSPAAIADIYQLIRCGSDEGDRDDDLALRMPGFDIGQRLPGLPERKHLVDEWPDDARFDQGRDLTQLLPLRTQEKESQVNLLMPRSAP